MSEYLTVVEVAKLAGVSYQAVYKRLNKGEFQGLIYEIDGKKLLNRRVLNCFQKNEGVGVVSEVGLEVGLLEKIVVRAVREQIKVVEEKVEILIGLEKQNQLRLRELVDFLGLSKDFKIQEMIVKEKNFKVEDIGGDEVKGKKWGFLGASDLDKLKK